MAIANASAEPEGDFRSSSAKEAVVRLAVATLVPLLPLALPMMPVEELLRRLVGLLF